MSGWNDSDRRDRLPPDWWRTVQRIKKRDGGRCTWRLPSHKRCPRAGTDVDHKVAGDDHSDANLQLLCATHHGRKTAGEAHRAKAKKKASRFRAPEGHPGSVR